MFAVIYCRISVPKPNENSLNAQEKIGRDFVQRNKLQIKYICRESGSAYTKTPIKLEQILTNEKNIVLIIKCIDRFSRSEEHGRKLLTLACKNKIQIVFIQEKIIFKDTASGNKVLEYIKEAEQEVKKMAQRIKDINQNKRSNGLHIGGAIPYGFSIKRTHLGNKLVSNQHEEAIIQFINFFRDDDKRSLATANKLLKKIDNDADPIAFDNKYGEPTNEMEGQYSYSQIAELLNEYHITKRGEKWKGSTVNSVYKKSRKQIETKQEMEISFQDLPDQSKKSKPDDDEEMAKMFREFQLFKQFMDKRDT